MVQEISFRPYWKKEKDKFEKEGILPCLDYPLYNDMINGMLFKSFDEIIKTEQKDKIHYNPNKNKFINNFHLYLDELKRDLSKMYSVVEINLHRVVRTLETKILPMIFKKDSKAAVIAKLARLHARTEQVSKFQQFNYEIFSHLVKKVGKQFDKLDINFEKEAIQHMIQDEVFNLFLGDIKTQESFRILTKVYFTFLQEYKHSLGQDEKEAIELKSYEISKAIEDLDMLRRKKLRSGPQDKFENNQMLFEKKKDAVLKQAEEDYDKLEQQVKESLKKDVVETELITIRPELPKAEEVKSLKQEQSLITTSKPQGDTKPLGDQDAEDEDEDKEEELEPHKIRNISKYWVDLSAGVQTQSVACYSKSAPWFVLVHTFVYMLTYYGITPTTYDYNNLMKVPKSLFGLMSAVTPFVAAISCFIYNIYTSVHYKTSYLISIICLGTGAFLYSLAMTHKSLIILLIGRCLFGYGGGRILTRKFFSREIHVEHRVFFSAMLVGFTGVAMTFGPGLSALLETVIDSDLQRHTKLDGFKDLSPAQQQLIFDNLTRFTIGGMRFSRLNYVPMITCLLFIIMLIVFIFWFEDAPARPKATSDQEKQGSDAVNARYQISDIKGMHFLPEDKKSTKYTQTEVNKKFDTWKEKMNQAKKFFTDGQTYYVCLYLFIIKAIQECIIVESPSYIIKNYGNNSQESGLIFFLFTIFTLPAALTPSLVKKLFEDRKVLLTASALLFIALFIKIQYSPASLQPYGLFIAGSCLVLGFALSVETCCSSIITKVISEVRANSFFNAGLMAGLIDTVGRVAGSISITIIQSIVDLKKLNTVLYPFWLICFALPFISLIWMFSRLDTKSYVRFG